MTNDNFVNFEDFALQANNWLIEGNPLAGDFYSNGIVDIYDFDYLATWWLRDCFSAPPDICPDCNYPDCNLMDCNVPADNPCQYCESTPPFIKVTINGNHGCGCSCDINNLQQGSGYVDPNYNINGNYILPYIGFCMWEGIYNHSTINIKGYYPGPCCTYDTDPNNVAHNYSKIKISVWTDGSLATLSVYFWNDYWQEWENFNDSLWIEAPINCIEGSKEYVECGHLQPDTMPPLFGDGSATISLPWLGR